jgi:hypothetical protein
LRSILVKLTFQTTRSDFRIYLFWRQPSLVAFLKRGLPGVGLDLVDSTSEMALGRGRRLSSMARVGGQLPP